MNKLTPLIKGVITGACMVALTLVLYFSKQPGNSPLVYLIYFQYAAGIGWALYGYYHSDKYTGKFGDIFGQGFRCFIIVTLIMVIYTGIFSKLHPEYAEESSRYKREELVKTGNRTPAMIDEDVAKYKKQYTTSLISVSIFGYLILGTIFTGVGAAVLLMRRK